MHHATQEQYPIGEEFGDRCLNNEGLSNALNDKECGLWIVVYRGSKDTEQNGKKSEQRGCSCKLGWNEKNIRERKTTNERTSTSPGQPATDRPILPAECHRLIPPRIWPYQSSFNSDEPSFSSLFLCQGKEFPEGRSRMDPQLEIFIKALSRCVALPDLIVIRDFN